MTIIVTGAAGSIGSEVCRQLIDMGEAVVGVDIAETPLFWLENELGTDRFVPVLASVTSAKAMNNLAWRFNPAVFIHAAALKHVWMTERNIHEAVAVNIGGTINVAAAASRARARMVLVSTDKAVHPTTIMGATKRVAEKWVGCIADARVIRLVNIWDSSGSLVPVIREQIAAGGPVTITDLRMERYFMTAQEAAAYIIQQTGGPSKPVSVLMVPLEVEPRSVHAIIREQLRLAGVPDMPVKVIGPKPGEKLVEELITPEERSAMANDEGMGGQGIFWFGRVKDFVRTCVGRSLGGNDEMLMARLFGLAETIP